METKFNLTARKEGERMTYRFTIPARLPGANEYIRSCRTNKFIANKDKHNTEFFIICCVPVSMRGLNLEKVKIKFTWVEQQRKRDPDNIRFGAKFILDALQQCKVLKQDNLSTITALEDEFVVNKTTKAHVIVEITEVQ